MKYEANRALEACNNMMVERLNLLMPTRLAWPTETAIRNSQIRLTREKATLCQKIEKIQTHIDMTGKTALQLSELVDSVFAYIVTKQGLKFANVSNHPSYCRFSTTSEKCGICGNGKEEVCTRATENCSIPSFGSFFRSSGAMFRSLFSTISTYYHRKTDSPSTTILQTQTKASYVTTPNDDFMPWRCWHPHFFHYSPHKLLRCAGDNLRNDPIFKPIQDATIFLNSLNAVAEDFSLPIIRSGISYQIPNLPESGNITTKPLDAIEPQATPSANIRQPKKRVPAKWLLRAELMVLIQESLEHLEDPEDLLCQGLSQKKLCVKIEKYRPKNTQKKEKTCIDPEKEWENKLAAVRAGIATLRCIFTDLRSESRIKSHPYHLIIKGDAEILKRDVFKKIKRLGRKKKT